MTVHWPVKDVAEKKKYGIDWSKRLVGDEIITASTFTVINADVSIHSQDYSDTHSIVWLTGGTADTTARLTCTVTTSTGAIWREDVQIKIVDRAT